MNQSQWVEYVKRIMDQICKVILKSGESLDCHAVDLEGNILTVLTFSGHHFIVDLYEVSAIGYQETNDA